MTKSPLKSDPADVIKQIIPNVNDNDYHDPTVKSVLVLARPKLGPTVNQLLTLMLRTLPVDWICHRKPTSVTYNGVFVVDLSCARCIDDLCEDDNGVWTHAGKPQRKYRIRHDPETCGLICADPVEDTIPESESFTLLRIYYHHKGTPEFQRRISYVIDRDGEKVQYAVVQYLFKGENEIPVIIPPPGNTKNKKASYRRTQKSTLSRIKQIPGKPKNVVSVLHR